MARVKVGSVHGRFQPFHNGHLDYVLQAFDRADFIWVGLTQIFRPTDDADLKNRENANADPLSFRDRAELVEAALVAAGIDRSRFRITPFPIEHRQHLDQFIPSGSVCFTTRVNEWNDEKIKRLSDQGFVVDVLDISVPDNMRVTSGTEIRRLFRDDDPTWARFVPPAVAEVISSRMRKQFALKSD